MNNISKSLLVFVIGFWTSVHAAELTANNNYDWRAISRNLEQAIASPNEGLKTSAMCQVIQYADNINLRHDAVVDLIHVFRTNPDPQIRHLVMVALYATQNRWAMGFLQRILRFEDDADIRKHGNVIVYHYYENELKPENSTTLNDVGGHLSPSSQN
ncbi:MAG: hypothetical protein ACP5FZ_08460 [Fidelibacterota bacterium]